MLTLGPRSVFQLRPAKRENRALCRGFLSKRMMGFEPTTFCMASGSWVRVLAARESRTVDAEPDALSAA